MRCAAIAGLTNLFLHEVHYADVNSIPTAIFNNSGTWIQTPSETTNPHPKSNTLGGYTFQALPTKDTTTHTLLTNPTTHYRASDIGVLPNNPNTWIPYSSTITKTIYDPCPYGYRIPKDGSWTGFTGNRWTPYAITAGTSWPKANGSWWPAAGYRYYDLASLCNMGNGNSWSASLYPSNAHLAYLLAFISGNGVYPSYNSPRSSGFSVRCIEE